MKKLARGGKKAITRGGKSTPHGERLCCVLELCTTGTRHHVRKGRRGGGGRKKNPRVDVGENLSIAGMLLAKGNPQKWCGRVMPTELELVLLEKVGYRKEARRTQKEEKRDKKCRKDSTLRKNRPETVTKNFAMESLETSFFLLKKSFRSQNLEGREDAKKEMSDEGALHITDDLPFFQVAAPRGIVKRTISEAAPARGLS